VVCVDGRVKPVSAGKVLGVLDIIGGIVVLVLYASNM